jgi:hypothetical protein
MSGVKTPGEPWRAPGVVLCLGTGHLARLPGLRQPGGGSVCVGSGAPFRRRLGDFGGFGGWYSGTVAQHSDNQRFRYSFSSSVMSTRLPVGDCTITARV